MAKWEDRRRHSAKAIKCCVCFKSVVVIHVCTLLFQNVHTFCYKVRVADIINSNLNMFSTLVTTKTAHIRRRNLFVWRYRNNRKKKKKKQMLATAAVVTIVPYRLGYG